MDFDKLEKEALVAFSQIPCDQTFLVKDLFKGYRWESFSPGVRRDFGKHFKRRYTIGAIKGIKYVGRAQNGSAQYMKIREEER